MVPSSRGPSSGSLHISRLIHECELHRSILKNPHQRECLLRVPYCKHPYSGFPAIFRMPPLGSSLVGPRVDAKRGGAI
eukprot:5755115-Pyramimonas_sp.AAC.1